MGSDRGTLFAVCCIADIPVEHVNSFLKCSYEFPISCEHMLVVIQDDGAHYSDATQLPITKASTAFFRGLSAEQCSLAIMSFVQNTKSNINYEYFTILDDRTTKDSTVLLVAGNMEDGGISVLRAAPEVANVTLASISAGVGSLSECAEIAAKESDGVYRLRPVVRESGPNSNSQRRTPGKVLKRAT